jgi:hypothetical protein
VDPAPLKVLTAVAALLEVATIDTSMILIWQIDGHLDAGRPIGPPSARLRV